DAGYVHVDSSRTSLSGYNGALGLARNSGRHWLWEVYGSARSPGFELNDAGAMSYADQLFGYANLRYRETQPGRVFRSYQIGVSSENQWNFGGVRNFAALRTDADATWKNFWRSTFTAWVDLPSQSDELTRGGPLMGTGQAWVVITSLANSTASRRRWNGRIYYGESELGEQTYRLSGGVSVRPGPRWQLSVDPNYLRSINPRQYIGTRTGGPEATFGNRYMFSFTDRSTFSMPLRLNYIVTPDLSLEAYAEPFAASGRFYDFGELPAPRSRDLRMYGSDGTRIQQQEDRSYLVSADGEEFRLRFRDFNVRSFRSNAVLRWEWRPGSTLFVVWQQDRYGEEARGALVGPRSLLETLNAAGDNILALKVTYWLPLR
nr:DUF5916 domain-containing protein [Gemmatimonadota bacterium]